MYNDQGSINIRQEETSMVDYIEKLGTTFINFLHIKNKHRKLKIHVKCTLYSNEYVHMSEKYSADLH